MIRTIFSWLGLLLLLFTTAHVANGQFSKEVFGKNRIQYRQFEWRYVSSQNFEIFYTEGGYELAVLAAKFAEEDLMRITDIVGFSPYNKIKLYIYQSVADLQQSNIGIYQQGVEVGGQTHFVRAEVEVAFTGNKHSFKQELSLGIADMLIFEMMYGGNLKQLLQSSYLLNLPEWFMAGAARYIAEGWSAEMDNYVRHIILTKKFKRPDKYTREEAAIIGHSIWNYIVEKYGAASVSNALNLTRIVRNERSAIENTFQVPYSRFLEDWQNFYRNHYRSVEKEHSLPAKEQIVLNSSRKSRIQQLRISPDGKLLAYTENQRGKYKVRVWNMQTKKQSVLYAGGHHVLNQRAEEKLPLIAWKDDNTLAVMALQNGRNTLWLYDVAKKKRLQRHSFASFSHINSIDISRNGDMMVLSAETGTNSNIYTYSFRGQRIAPVTSDFYDNISPHFLADGNGIAFSSNRVNDTLKVGEADMKAIASNFNVFVYQPNAKVLKRITNSYGMNIHPQPVGSDSLIFLSDQRGIAHLYGYEEGTGLLHQITNYGLNIEEFDLRGSTLVFSMLDRGEVKVFLLEGFSHQQATFTPKTARQQFKDLRMLEKIRKERQEAKTTNKKPEKDTEADTDNYKFDSYSKNRRKKFVDKFKNTGPDTLNIGGLSSIPGVAKGPAISKSAPYENQFTTDNFVTSLLIDPMRSVYGSGLGLIFEMQMTDLLENHKLNGGLFGLTNLNNSSFFGQYEYLKHRIDGRLRYDMKNLEIPSDFAYFQRYRLNTIEASASYPFNLTTRITVAPFFEQTRYILGGTLNATSLYSRPDAVRQYAGGRIELVFDNTKSSGTNPSTGTRFRMGLTQHVGINRQNIGFGEANLELRHYQKIYKSLVFATKLTVGHYYGAAPKRYILGGMDNWVGSKVDKKAGNDILNVEPELGQVRDLSDLMFSKFVTNMRGFNYNVMNGSSHLLLNAELRLPLLKAFYRGTITSNFFRNLQLAAFTDIGAAWSGTGPFQRKNAVNTVPIPKQGGFSGSVTSFTNPFLIGYGFGARTMLLSYYVKLDFAWGMAANVNLPVKTYITLGYDF